MVLLPELINGLGWRLEILYGDCTWKTGGQHAILPSRDRPQITAIDKNCNIKKRQFKIVLSIFLRILLRVSRRPLVFPSTFTRREALESQG
jgi:hypothetical protein